MKSLYICLWYVNSMGIVHGKTNSYTLLMFVSLVNGWFLWQQGYTRLFPYDNANCTHVYGYSGIFKSAFTKLNTICSLCSVHSVSVCPC